LILSVQSSTVYLDCREQSEDYLSNLMRLALMCTVEGGLNEGDPVETVNRETVKLGAENEAEVECLVL
jgi:hypothetical protein